jgi:hypothetical protein
VRVGEAEGEVSLEVRARVPGIARDGDIGAPVAVDGVPVGREGQRLDALRATRRDTGREQQNEGKPRLRSKAHRKRRHERTSHA